MLDTHIVVSGGILPPLFLSPWAKLDADASEQAYRVLQ